MKNLKNVDLTIAAVHIVGAILFLCICVIGWHLLTPEEFHWIEDVSGLFVFTFTFGIPYAIGIIVNELWRRN